MVSPGLSLQCDLLAPTAYLPRELADRIFSTLADKSLPAFAFNTLMALSELADPHGGAVPLAEVQRYAKRVIQVDLGDRTIKAAVRLLIDKYGVAIGSARGKRHGYFFITTDEEATAAAAPLLAEIRSLAARCRTLSPKNPYIQHLLGQMEVHP